MHSENLLSSRAVLSVIRQKPVIPKIKPIWPKYKSTYYKIYMFNRNIFFCLLSAKQNSPVDRSFKIGCQEKFRIDPKFY